MGNKHIIPLVAAGNRGKTHTLNLLARHFIQDLNAKILNEVHYTEFDDHIYVLKINSAEKEHIIVVSTQGDDSSHIEKAKSVVDEYLNENSKEDLFWFLACRTSGSSFNKVVEYDYGLEKRYWMYKSWFWTTDGRDFSDSFRRWDEYDALKLLELYKDLSKLNQLECI